MMESVEDIPADAILDGLAWDWETYGEYYDSIDRLPKGPNAGGLVGHCALRTYVMGERGLDEAPATGDDIVAMARLVDEAMAAGALGLSTSRTFLHRVPDGRPVPGTHAAADELLAFAEVLGRHRRRCVRRRDAPRRARRRALRQHAVRDRVDGRDQPAERPPGQLRPDPVRTAGPALFEAVIEFAKDENASGAVHPAADDGPRRRCPVRSRSRARRSTGRRRGRNCAPRSTVARCR